VVLREVDDAETADADDPQDLELAEARAERQRIVFDRGRRGSRCRRFIRSSTCERDAVRER